MCVCVCVCVYMHMCVCVCSVLCDNAMTICIVSQSVIISRVR